MFARVFKEDYMRKLQKYVMLLNQYRMMSRLSVEMKHKELMKHNDGKSMYVNTSKIEGPLITRHIRDKINKANNEDLILQLVNRYDNCDSSVYGCAIKRLNELNQYDYMEEIMIKAMDNGQYDEVLFTNFLYGMGKCGELKKCIALLDKMFKEYNVKPTLVLFTVILECYSFDNCVKYRKDIEWIVDMMVNKYDIKLDAIVCTILFKIYAKIKDIDRAKYIWDNYFITSQNNSNPRTWGAYLNVYAKVGMIDDVLRVFGEMKSRNVQMTHVTYGIIMDSYLKVNQPLKALEYYDELITSNITPKLNILGSRYIAYLKIYYNQKLGNHRTEHNNEYYYHKIMKQYMDDLKKYELKPDFKVYMIQFNCVILHYFDQNPMEMVRYFEMNKKYLQYLVSPQMIDLHHFPIVCAQFVIRYILAYELQTVCSNKKFEIICGKTVRNKSNHFQLINFVINELQSFDIECNIQPKNNGRIDVFIRDDTQRQIIKNKAIKYFTDTSHDWHFDWISKNR